MNNAQLWEEANRLENTLWHKLQADFTQTRLHNAWKHAFDRQFRRYVRSMG